MSDRLMTAEELAGRWQVPKSHVYRLAREGKLPTVQLGRYRRWSLDAIEDFERGTEERATVAGTSKWGRGALTPGPRHRRY
jgi:excisionase family DNA binding protein